MGGERRIIPLAAAGRWASAYSPPPCSAARRAPRRRTPRRSGTLRAPIVPSGWAPPSSPARRLSPTVLSGCDSPSTQEPTSTSTSPTRSKKPSTTPTTRPGLAACSTPIAAVKTPPRGSSRSSSRRRWPGATASGSTSRRSARVAPAVAEIELSPGPLALAPDPSTRQPRPRGAWYARPLSGGAAHGERE